MTLLLLAIAATTLAGVVRASLRRAVRASAAQEELQRRWAVTSCRTVLLPKAERALARPKVESAEVRRQIRLGGQAVTLVFGDEQAKPNVNVLYRQRGLADAERAVRALSQGTGNSLAVELRPLPADPRGRARADSDEGGPPFEGFSQIFGATPPRQLLARRGSRPSVASAVTCWGDGTLHFRRASRDALQQACRPYLGAGDVGRLLAVRQRRPDADAGEALDRLKLTEARREALEELLVDESSCHSLWVVVDTGGRVSYDLFVSDDTVAGAAGTVRFSW